jgi:hypothetical protein
MKPIELKKTSDSNWSTSVVYLVYNEYIGEQVMHGVTPSSSMEILVFMSEKHEWFYQ